MKMITTFAKTSSFLTSVSTRQRQMAPATQMNEPGPVQLPRGKIIGRRWRVVKKLGEGGCGAVYKVEDITKKGDVAALKAESNFVAGGSVLKLEVQILRRLEGRQHVAMVLHSGKKDTYCYMVMTLLGDSLNNIMKRIGKVSSVSTQTRVGINVLFGIKQIHDIGFVHRDLKPANVAVGRPDTPEARYLHVLDFGLAREFVVLGEDKELCMRKPRERALFRGTTRYCSMNTHERTEQGRVDDLWSLLYMLAEMRGPLPWAHLREKKEVYESKKATEDDTLLHNCPVEYIQFCEHLRSLNYYNRPDYALLNGFLTAIMTAGKFKWTDPLDWEVKKGPDGKVGVSRTPTVEASKDTTEDKQTVDSERLKVPLPVTGAALPREPRKTDPANPFPAEEFETNPLGF